MCKAIRLSFEIESSQALKGNNLRPDILIQSGEDGYDLALELTIVNPTHNENSTFVFIYDKHKVLRQFAIKKTRKYEECGNNGSSFVPIFLNVFRRVFDESYSNGIHFLLHKIKRTQFESPNWTAPNRKAHWLQRMIITLQIGDALQVGNFLRKKPIRC